MKRQELLVAALESGTVIDHIPSSKLFEVVNLLHLEQMKTSITVGYNLKSKKMGFHTLSRVNSSTGSRCLLYPDKDGKSHL